MDNTFFDESTFIDYCYNKIVFSNYEDIEKVSYSDNVWEHTRPGYRGNHFISMQAKAGNLIVLVRDEEKVKKLINVIWSKNKKAQYENYYPQEETDLQMIGNWQVPLRF